MIRLVARWTLFCLSFPFFASSTPANDLTGARDLLRELSEEKTEESESPIEALRAELETLPPDAAAKRWLDAADLVLTGSGSGDPFGNDGFSSLLEALPGPDSWPHLQKAIAESERELLAQLHLELLAATLTENLDLQWESLLAIEKQLVSGQGSRGNPGGLGNRYFANFRYRAAGELLGTFAIGNDDPEKVKELLRRRAAYPHSDFSERIDVPDLVALLGEAEARHFLKELFRETKSELRFDRGEATQQLAREVAKEQIDELGTAPWALIDGPEQTDFYEALIARFPAPAESRYDRARTEAFNYYVIGLALQGDSRKAMAVLEESKTEDFSIPYGFMDKLREERYRQPVFRLLEQILEKNPELPLWEEYLFLAVESGGGARALPFLQKMLENREWDPAARAILRARVAELLLATDQVDEGVSMLIEEAKALLAGGGVGSEYHYNSQLLLAGPRIARIGHLLSEPEWVQAGLELSEAASEFGRGFVQRGRIRFHEEIGELEQAQELLINQLRAEVRALGERSWGIPNTRSVLIDLARIYHKAGKPEEVLVLLRDAPWWGGPDLASMLAESGSGKLPIGYLAASALGEMGETEEAVLILKNLLLHQGGFDPAWQRLQELDPAETVAWADYLFALDPFEERPLIWKAVIALESGELREAKELVERAIAIDPSDGEQGPGDRMRAYAVLADVLEKMGEENKAAFYREVVTSIRMSEEADKLYSAGLKTRGIRLYQEALEHFADAYCIQSRLARQLQEIGFHEEAEKHYRRAYELMPDSFGRVESHCFGCEAVFEGESAHRTAERVFSRLRQERPEQPQVWYLSGYLNFERGQYGEALEQLVRAVELDPDYLNAWKKIAMIGRRTALDRNIRNRTALELIRLDPLQRHLNLDLAGVTDLTGLWIAFSEALERRPSQPKSLLELPATREFISQLPGGADRYAAQISSWIQPEVISNPSELLSQHPLLKAIASSLNMLQVR